MKEPDERAGSDAPSSAAASTDYIRLHLKFGWWTLALFLAMGIALEVLHGLKLGLYLDVSNETRRLMWTLAHAHGTLVALVNIAFALTLSTLGWGARGDKTPTKGLRTVSRCLLAGGLLLPLGFLLGGVWIYDGDPGLGILLVPVGALLLLVGVVLVARAQR